MWVRGDDRRVFTTLLVLLIGLAWTVLWAWGRSPYARFLSHADLGNLTLKDGGVLLVFVGGWTLMSAAMMLPTSLPLVTMFHTLVRQRPDRTQLVALLMAGYLGVWVVFGMIVHLIDWTIHAVVDSIPWVATHASVLGATTLVLAGCYQFTPLKYYCLDKCRSPLSFIVEHWRGRHEHRQALLLGIHHGLFCVGCCWALMLLMFAVGVGNLGWMLMLGTVMAIEKNMPWGRQLSAPLAVVLIGWGLVLVVTTAWDTGGMPR